MTHLDARTAVEPTQTDIYLFSTTNVASGRHDELQRMVRSVDAAREERPDCSIRLLVLLQNARDHAAPDLPGWVEVHTILGLVPLSTARNMLLARVDLPRAATTRAVVAFPDDDAWYLPGTLHFMTDLIARHENVDFVVCRSGTQARSPGPDTDARPMRLQQAISHGSSNTIFVHASVAARLESFDEQLGLGTPAVAGEDTDYAIRAWHEARRSLFVDAALVGHRDNDPALKKRYHQGALQAIRKHRSRSPAAKIALARKHLVGLNYKFR
ncbi:glycosyltransferase family 2 protein [Sphingomonas sp. Mn802worker]|uniref:glycosyltransferase family 2 protein n=1 Tax=Sphingomonas sp. Mn802worker TaxID=629773 RepID=UPI000370E25C|nr:hypothetical protein [Sphingomonas sp. Mn802worker]